MSIVYPEHYLHIKIKIEEGKEPEINLYLDFFLKLEETKKAKECWLITYIKRKEQF